MDCASFSAIYKAKIKGKELEDFERYKIAGELLNTRHYIGILEKEKIVKEILSKLLVDSYEVKYNSFEKYLLFVTTMISTYTDLKMDIKGYDILCSQGILNDVIGSFESEYKICLGILESYLDDLYYGRLTGDMVLNGK